MAYLNPGKTRMEIKTGNISMLDVCDGETTWVYNSMAKQYAKIPPRRDRPRWWRLMGVKLPDMSPIHHQL